MVGAPGLQGLQGEAGVPGPTGSTGPLGLKGEKINLSIFNSLFSVFKSLNPQYISGSS